MTVFGAVVLLLLLFVVVVWVAHVFNHLVLVRHNVGQAWSNVLVLLRQRQTELTKLVEVCRQYADFEASLLARLTEARAAMAHSLESGDVATLDAADRRLHAQLSRVIATAEAHPRLRAEANFTHLAERISTLETGIAARREFYNEQVRINNVTVTSFPSILLAQPFGFRPMAFLDRDARRDGLSTGRASAAG